MKPHLAYPQIFQSLLDLLFGKGDSVRGCFGLFMRGGGIPTLTRAVDSSFERLDKRHLVGGQRLLTLAEGREKNWMEAGTDGHL